MIKNIIFDFGDVFLNLDKEAPFRAFQTFGLMEWHADIQAINEQFEVGAIDEEQFLTGFQEFMPKGSTPQIKKAWNSMLLDFPEQRLNFLMHLSEKYQLFLLSNTDAIHIENFEETHGENFSNAFYQCFKKVYFSFEIGLRKPNANCFQYVINNHHLIPKETLFVDDRLDNIETAASLGLHVWHLQVGQETVLDLFNHKNFPF
jgi:putative hydrolase of the HAD superfamily